MSIEVLSQERFILSCIEEYVWSLSSQKGAAYSWAAEFGIAELVRLQMRQLAQTKANPESELLESAIETVQVILDEWCAGSKLSFDFTVYFENVRKGLRFAAKEMGGLSRQLALSRQAGRVAFRERLTHEVTIPLEIVPIGLQNAIEALFVVPLTEEFALNLGRVSEIYAVEGQWFPYQILIEPLNLLLDDDGTILIPVLGASEALMEQAKEALVILAAQLYEFSLDD